MPANRTFPITAEYIEQIHDEGIAIAWPGLEPVHPNDCLDRNLLTSAAEQPFQGGYGVDYFYPTLYDKAACLFFSIAGGHIFGNGNKRTAVVTLDLFLVANSMCLVIPNGEMYRLAIQTATYRTRGEDQQAVKVRIAAQIEENCIEFRKLRKKHRDFWSTLHSLRKMVRRMNAEVRTPNR